MQLSQWHFLLQTSPACDGVCDAILETERDNDLHCKEDGGCEAGRNCCSVGKNNIRLCE